MKKQIYLISILSLIVSIVALCIAIVRCEPIEANWYAILITVLGLLVTVLIGWQIAHYLIAQEEIKSLRKRTAELVYKSERLEKYLAKAVYHTQVISFYHLAYEAWRRGDVSSSIPHCYNSLIAYWDKDLAEDSIIQEVEASKDSVIKLLKKIKDHLGGTEVEIEEDMYNHICEIAVKEKLQWLSQWILSIKPNHDL
jgi:hypothetical protein